MERVQKEEVVMFKCQVCGSNSSHLEYVSEVFDLNGKFHLVERIPATVCDRCGEELFQPGDD